MVATLRSAFWGKKTLGQNRISTFSPPISTVGRVFIPWGLLVKPVEPRLHLFLNPCIAVKFHEISCVYQLSVYQSLSWPLGILHVARAFLRWTNLGEKGDSAAKTTGSEASEASGGACQLGLFEAGTPVGTGTAGNSYRVSNETDVIWCGLGFVADLFGVTETPRNDKVNIKIFKFKKYTQHLMFKVKACSRAKLQVEVHFGESPPCSHAGCPASVAPEVPLRVHQVPDLWNLVVSSVNHRVHIF